MESRVKIEQTVENKEVMTVNCMNQFCSLYPSNTTKCRNESNMCIWYSIALKEIIYKK